MTCRHSPGDPACSSSPAGQRRAAEDNARYWENKVKEITPDADKFEILEVEEVGPVLILKVKYPSCVKCAYEGTKILVYKGVALKEVVKWKRIDPHFADPKKGRQVTEAPSPAARFPASPEGWKHALDFARFLNGRP
jgi:hypothetical protein